MEQHVLHLKYYRKYMKVHNTAGINYRKTKPKSIGLVFKYHFKILSVRLYAAHFTSTKMLNM
jgi:hypothetical protein